MDHFPETHKRFAGDDRMQQINMLFEQHADEEIEEVLARYGQDAAVHEQLRILHERLSCADPRSRRSLLAESVEDIQHDRPVAIVGHQGLGKTTFLYGVLSRVVSPADQRLVIDMHDVPGTVLAKPGLLRLYLVEVFESFATRLGANIPAMGMRTPKPAARMLEWLVEDHILPAIRPGRLYLVLDNLHLLFGRPEGEDFFGMLRVWCSPYRFDGRLRILASSSLPVSYAGGDIHRSPLNIGPWHELPEIDEDEVREHLMRQLPTTTLSGVRQLMKWIGGHPALLDLVTQDLRSIGAVEHLLNDLDRGCVPRKLDGHMETRRQMLSSMVPECMLIVRDIIAGIGVCSEPSAYRDLLALGIVRRQEHGQLALRYKLYRFLAGRYV